MANVGTELRETIRRLSRGEVRKEAEAAKRATTQHRHAIAELKREVAELERQVALLTKNASRPRVATSAQGTQAPRFRFSAKGLLSHRNRLGLSAAQYGKLIGVSPQAIYNWEQGHGVPRTELIAKIAELRTTGKREVARKLELLRGERSRGRGAPDA